VVKIRRFFSSEDIFTFLALCETGQNIRSIYDRRDPDGSVTNIATWDAPPTNVEGGVSMVDRLQVVASELLGERACHFHTKLVSKSARVGRSWQWHQDYWNWYHAGFFDSRNVKHLRCSRRNG
jgi:hypothetical protein